MRDAIPMLSVITLPDGAQIKLGDVATINDGFEEGLLYSKYNGKNSLSFEIVKRTEHHIMTCLSACLISTLLDVI